MSKATFERCDLCEVLLPPSEPRPAALKVADEELEFPFVCARCALDLHDALTAVVSSLRGKWAGCIRRCDTIEARNQEPGTGNEAA